MTNFDLLMGLNELEDELVLDAQEPTPASLSRKRVWAILLAAAFALCLIGCTYAVLSEADWFKDFFSDKIDQDLSEGQEAYIEERTQEIAQSVTIDGYTLTIESAIADQYNAYIKLRIQAPPGVILDAESYLPGYRRLENGELEKTLYREDGKEVAYVGSMGPLDDGDPKDDSFLILYRINLANHTEATFYDEGTWKLHLWNMDACYDSGEFITIMEGAMDFDIVFSKIGDEEVVLVSDPIPYSFKTYRDNDAYLNNDPDYTEGFLTSVILRSMSAEISIEGIDIPAGFITIPIVMKDGSRVEMHSHSFGTGVFSYSLDAPIVLADVDHILLEDGTKLYPPQE